MSHQGDDRHSLTLTYHNRPYPTSIPNLSTLTISSLHAATATALRLPPTTQPPALHYHYTDDEGDRVSLSTTDELAELLAERQAAGRPAVLDVTLGAGVVAGVDEASEAGIEAVGAMGSEADSGDDSDSFVQVEASDYLPPHLTSPPPTPPLSPSPPTPTPATLPATQQPPSQPTPVASGGVDGHSLLRGCVLLDHRPAAATSHAAATHYRVRPSGSDDSVWVQADELRAVEGHGTLVEAYFQLKRTEKDRSEALSSLSWFAAQQRREQPQAASTAASGPQAQEEGKKGTEVERTAAADTSGSARPTGRSVSPPVATVISVPPATPLVTASPAAQKSVHKAEETKRPSDSDEKKPQRAAVANPPAPSPASVHVASPPVAPAVVRPCDPVAPAAQLFDGVPLVADFNARLRQARRVVDAVGYRWLHDMRRARAAAPRAPHMRLSLWKGARAVTRAVVARPRWFALGVVVLLLALLGAKSVNRHMRPPPHHQWASKWQLQSLEGRLNVVTERGKQLIADSSDMAETVTAHASRLDEAHTRIAWLEHQLAYAETHVDSLEAALLVHMADVEQLRSEMKQLSAQQAAQWQQKQPAAGVDEPRYEPRQQKPSRKAAPSSAVWDDPHRHPKSTSSASSSSSSPSSAESCAYAGASYSCSSASPSAAAGSAGSFDAERKSARAERAERRERKRQERERETASSLWSLDDWPSSPTPTHDDTHPHHSDSSWWSGGPHHKAHKGHKHDAGKAGDKVMKGVKHASKHVGKKIGKALQTVNDAAKRVWKSWKKGRW